MNRDIQINDYIEGYEDNGTFDNPKLNKVRGWVTDIRSDNEGKYYKIKADDKYCGARGTTVSMNNGEIKILGSPKNKQ